MAFFVQFCVQNILAIGYSDNKSLRKMSQKVHTVNWIESTTFINQIKIFENFTILYSYHEN